VTDRTAVAAAVVVAIAAVLAPPVPTSVALALVAVAIASRRAPLLVLAVALLAGARAHDQMDALAAPLPDTVEGVATVVEDPQPQEFGERVLFDVQGRRYVAQVSTELAAPLRSVGVGDHLSVRGRVRSLDDAPRGWVLSRHLAGRVSFTQLERGPPAAPWYAAANAVRRTLTEGAASFDPERRPLYLGMVIGDDRELSELREFRFRAAGLTHLTAVSGQNIAFVVAVAAPLLGRLGRRARAAATFALLVGLVLVTRADPSVLRASVMASFAVLAVASGRVAPALRVLALTITTLVLVDPMLVHALGFRLSVAATAGLILLSGPIAERLPGPSWVRTPVSITLAAQLATAPLIVELNGGISPASIVANLLAVPAAGAVMMLGATVGAVAGLVAEPIAAVIQAPARLLVTWIDSVATAAASAPVAVLGPARLVLLTGVIGTVLVVAPRHVHRRQGSRALPVLVVRLGAVVATMVLCWPPVPSSAPASAGIQVVVDRCGAVAVQVSGGSGVLDALDAVRRAAVRRIDLLVVDPGRMSSRTASAMQEQWPVRRRVDVGPGSAGTWTVGRLGVVVEDEAARIDTSSAVARAPGAECRLAR
jgi:competence protein ComEC